MKPPISVISFGAWVLLCWLALAGSVVGQAGAVAADVSAESKTESERLFAEATALREQRRYSEALPLAKRALALDESDNPPDTVRILRDLTLITGLLNDVGDDRAAVPFIERTLAIYEDWLGPEHELVAFGLSYLAQTYQAIGDYRRALPLFKRCLAIVENSPNTERRLVANSLNNIALLYREMGDYDQALLFQQRSLAIYEEVLSPDSSDLAVGLNNLATVYREKGDYARALPLAQRSLAIYEKLHGPEHRDVAVGLSNLGRLYYSMGAYSQALPLYRRSLAIREKALGPEHLDVALSLLDLADLHQELGDYQRALPMYQRGLAIQERALGPKHRFVATSLDNLANLYTAMGEYSEALPLYRRGLAIRENALGPAHPDVAVSLNNLSGLYSLMGAYGQALPLQQRSLAIREKALGPEHPDVATSLNNLAMLYKSMGDYGRALSLYQRSLAILEKALGPDHPKVAIGLNNLALHYDLMGDYGRALPMYERSLAIQEKALGPENAAVAVSLNNLAELYRKRGNFDRALPLYQRGLAIFEKALGTEHPNVAIVGSNLALLHEAMGDYDQALPLYQRSISSLVGNGNVPETLSFARANLASLYAKQGQPELAIFEGKRAVNLLQALRGQQKGLDRQLQKSFLDKNKYTYEQLIGWLVDAGRLSEAQQVLAMLKQHELDQFTRGEGDQDPKTAQVGLFGAEMALEKEQAQLASDGQAIWKQLEPLETRLREGRVKDAGFMLPKAEEDERVRLKDALTDLNERNVAYANKWLEVFANRKVQLGDVKLEDFNKNFQRMARDLARESGRKTVVLQYVLAEDGLLILRHDAQRSQAVTVTVKSVDLNHQIQALQQALLDPRADPRPAARALYDELIKPLEAGLAEQGAQHLMVSMTGALRYIPFAALYDGKQWLVERYSVSLFSETSTDYLDRKPGAWTLAGFGLTHQVQGFKPLPAVKEEFAGIRRAGLQGEVRLDEQFTAASLRASVEARQAPVLHLASHFALSRGGNGASYLLLGDGSQLSLKDMGHYPMDGIELLALSACQTALSPGADAGGGEVESLGGMMADNGAYAVLASLWSVADASTAQLMQRFYAHRQQDKLPKAEALRQAQLEMIGGKRLAAGGPARGAEWEQEAERGSAAVNLALQGYRHPYYWAPFVLMGNWL